MKKITERKELNAATFDNSRLPLKNCEFWDDDETDPIRFKGVLNGIKYGKYPFIRLEGSHFKYCTQIIERYPRDVPEGLAELPEDKPFLAYLGEMSFDDLKKSRCHILLNDEWMRAGCGIHGMAGEWVYPGAIDVSTEKAKEKFPEIVEAMEYEPIYESRIVSEGVERNLVGHKLGDKTYDLNWNRLKSEKNLELTPDDVFGSENQIVDDNKKVKEGPEDFGELVKKAEKEYYNSFLSGKERGKWEECQRWKDEISKFFNNDYKDWYGNSDEELPAIVRQALEDAELRDEIAYTCGAQWKYKTDEDYVKTLTGYRLLSLDQKGRIREAFRAAREIREVK